MSQNHVELGGNSIGSQASHLEKREGILCKKNCFLLLVKHANIVFVLLEPAIIGFKQVKAMFSYVCATLRCNLK